MSVDNTETINILSLCTGYGGLEIGLSRALEGVFRVVAVEVEAYALANLAAKTQEGKLAIEAMWPDLKTFPAERFRGCFDFVLAGYPCQPFSVAGKRQGTDDPRHLWPHIARIVQAVRPVWCFFENVPGHLTIGFAEVYRSLRDMGYSVEAGLFTAAEIGAPHRRERLFILAHANGPKPRTNTRANNGTTEKIWRQDESNVYGGYAKPTCSAASKLADTRRDDGQRLQQKEQPKELPKKLSGSGKLAHAECAESGERVIEKTPAGSRGNRFTIDRWPSRPGQLQYEWEEPRVVENACQRRRIQQKEGEGRNKNGWIVYPGGQRQAKSRLGRATSRNTCRVDRLRLLGNGVVPQQAERAFRYLMERFQ